MADPEGKAGQFSATVNGKPRAFNAAELHPGEAGRINLALDGVIDYGDQITVGYTAGDAASLAGKALASFNGEHVTNFVPRYTAVKLIAAGYRHSLAVRPDGTVAAWGYNGYGQCNVPAGLSDVAAVTAGEYHSLALKGDGTITSWALNNWGQGWVSDLTNVTAIDAGAWHSLYLRSDGTVVARGWPERDQCNVPQDLGQVVALAGGYAHTLALKADGTVAAWGYRSYGQCDVQDLSDVVAIATANLHTLALRADGTVVARGYNGYGQCSVPADLNNVVAIAAGGVSISGLESQGHSLALKADGTVVAWGYNGYGQCDVPAGLRNVVAIDAGNNHSLALKVDGTVVAWGANLEGQCSVPQGLVLSLPVDDLIALDKGALTWESIKGQNSAANSVTTGLILPAAGANGTTISWSADAADWIDTSTGAVIRPGRSQGDKTVTLTATISKTGGTTRTKDFILTIKAWSSKSRRTPTTPTPTYYAAVSGSSMTGTNLPVNVDPEAGSATVDLGTLTGDIFTGDETTVINVPSIPGVNTYTLGIPASILSGSHGEGSLTFATDVGSITVPNNMLSGIPGIDGKEAGITIGQGDKSNLPDDVKEALGDRPLVQLTLTVDGQQTVWNNPDAPVRVSIPYTPTEEELADPEHITVWYIDGQGNVVSVPSGRYDPATGTVTFSTTHFSHYAVAYVHKTFSDLGGVEWARKPIEVMASKGIINGTSATTCSPATSITRADYLVLLIKTLGLTADFSGNFEDAAPGAYYYEAIGTAKKLGIAAGSGNNRFNPQENISRQDMMVMTARALEKFKGLKAAGDTSVLDKFSDRGDIAGYAAASLATLATLVAEGLIAGDRDKLNPRAQTTRAEAAVFLYRIYNKYEG